MFRADRKTLLRFGLRAVDLIVERTLRGIDKYGRPFRPYSTNTLFIPARAVTKRARAILQKSGDLSYFKTKNSTIWIVVNGGYKRLKDAIFAQAGGAGGVVNLSLTGKMLRALAVVEVDEARQLVSIGFTRTEEAQKAYWNSLRGREFLGLSPEDLKDEEIAKLLVEGIALDS